MKILDGLVLSLQLFTRLPIKKEIAYNKENLNLALHFLPFIGLLIGLAQALVMAWARGMSPSLAGLVGLMAYLVLSGAMHLDGLADMADGFLSNTSREKTIQIMKDPNLGLFGSLAVNLYCLFKFVAYSKLATSQLSYLPLACYLARTYALIIIQLGPLAGSASFGADMKDALAQARLGLAYPTILILASLIFGSSLVLVNLALLGSSYLIIRLAEKKLGGLTGDIYGASIEINDCLALLVLLLLRG